MNKVDFYLVILRKQDTVSQCIEVTITALKEFHKMINKLFLECNTKNAELT